MSATRARRGTVRDEETSCRLALAVADVGWFNVDNLFREVERDDVATLLLECMDFGNAWSRGLPPWSWGRRLSQSRPGLWRREMVLPSGWMKRYPGVGMRPIARAIRLWRRDHAPGGRLALVATYPYYLRLRDLVRPDLLVYFNIDDYALYWPGHAEEVRALERRAVREADLTVCVSRLRADELRAAVPEAAERVRHLPHGAPSSWLPERPWEHPASPPDDLAAVPGPRLGYVGTMEDRVDWGLLDRLAEAMPGVSLVLIGKPGPPRGEPWQEERARCLSRPNVHALGWRAQGEIHRYNRAFDACLIPYLVDHPFNRACNPTKITDYMVTGRPIVATAVPECRHYDELFHVAEDEGGFVAAVRSILDAGSDDGRAAGRHAWARANTCRLVADRLIGWLPD
jgi:teichuronic acid biosynthesis glycosyltransferase TuaH